MKPKFFNPFILGLIAMVWCCPPISVRAQVNDSLPPLVTLSGESHNLETLLREVSQSSSIRFVYGNDRIPLELPIALKAGHYRTNNLFQFLFERNNIEYAVTGTTVILIKKVEEKPPPPPPEFTLSGTVKDAYTGELLLGATIYLDSDKGGKINKGAVSNLYGFYSLTLPQGTHEIKVSFVGYQSQTLIVQLTENRKQPLKLVSKTSELSEVTVEGALFGKQVERLEMGTHRLDMQQFGKMPYLYGEIDVLRAIRNFPGISSLAQAGTGFNVRGGNVDQNYVLLDEAPLFNTSHFFGLVSVFNPDIVKDVQLFKGNIPARYGGRISSVVDVRQREGNDQQFSLRGGFGLLSSRFAVEAPLIKGKSSFLLSTRSSFTDLSQVMLRNTNLSNGISNFAEYNTKINYKADEKNRFYLSGYYGWDESEFLVESSKIFWSNAAGTFRWNHIANEKLFMNITGLYSDYRYRISNPEDLSGPSLFSRNISYRTKADISYFHSLENFFEFGADLAYNRFKPGQFEFSLDGEVERTFFLENENAIDAAFYAGYELTLSDQLKWSAGIRYSIFQNIGPGQVYQYAPDRPRSLESLIDTVRYGMHEPVSLFHGPEPRFSLRYLLNKSSSFKFSYNRQRQYIHLVSNTTNTIFSDIWKPSGPYVKPQISDQIALGYFREFGERDWEISAEIFYKKMQNLLNYKDGASLLLNPLLETELLQGKGRAYGLELLMTKNTGKLTGWLAYTISRSERRVAGDFPEETINGGDFFPADFDRLHNLNLSGLYHINDKWTVSASFTYSTGRPVSLPDGQFIYEGLAVPYFSDRNDGRLPDHHRIDLSATMRGRTIKKKGKRAGEPKHLVGNWTFSIYNVYSRRNVFSVRYTRSPSNPTQLRIEQYPIFRYLIPSATYNFQWIRKKPKS